MVLDDTLSNNRGGKMSRRKSYFKVLTSLSETLRGKKVKEIWDYNDLVSRTRTITIKFEDGSELTLRGKKLKYSYFAG